MVPLKIIRDNGRIKNVLPYWTKRKCAKEARKFKLRGEFAKGSKSAYTIAAVKGWLDDICKHMKRAVSPKIYWTKERCKKEALKYKTKIDFQKRSLSAYRAMHRRGCVDECCKHMIRLGNRYNKTVYLISFNDGVLYVGITSNHLERFRNHLKRGPIYKYARKTKQKPKLELLTEYINFEKAVKKEQRYIDLYKKKGFILLNTAKAGSVGGGIRKWTEELLRGEAKKYTTLKDFTKFSPLAYATAHRRKLIKEYKWLKKYAGRTKKMS